MEPVIRDGRAFCPHCDWPLKPAAAGALRCGICASEFAPPAAPLVERTVSSAEEIERAKALLKAERVKEDLAIGTFDVIDTSDHALPRWKVWLSLFGMPVEEEHYGTARFPWMSFVFVAVCFLVHFGSEALGKALYLDPSHPFRLGGLTLFTYSVVHGDFLHLFFNLLFVWPFLDNVEEGSGTMRFALLLGSTAVAAGAVHMAFDDSGLPLVGSSGICFGVMANYCLRFPRNRFLVAIPFVGLLAYRHRLRVRAWGLFLFYVAMELLALPQQQAGLTNTSHLGHLGGALAGIALFYVTKGYEPD